MNESVISDDLVIDGDLQAKDSNLLVHGRITGDVTAKSVNIGPNGRVDGSVSAEDVSIDGKLKGSVTCTDLSLNGSASVEADVSVKTLTSARGAKLSGKVEVAGG